MHANSIYLQSDFDALAMAIEDGMFNDDDPRAEARGSSQNSDDKYQSADSAASSTASSSPSLGSGASPRPMA